MKTTKSTRLNARQKAVNMASEYQKIKLRKAAIKDEIESLYGTELEALNEREMMLGAELEAFGIANEKDFDSRGHYNLDHVILKKGSEYKLLPSPNFNALDFANSFPDLVKIELRRGEIKKVLSSGDKRKGLLKLGLDGTMEDIIKIELPKVA